jgi:hypothetical protein
MVDITDGLIRISVGLEHIDDIKADIFQALESSEKAASNGQVNHHTSPLSKNDSSVGQP